MVQFYSLEVALSQPETANLARLWQEVEQKLAGLSREEMLRAAGEAIAQLAEIQFARAQWMLNHWEDQWNDCPLEVEEEPVLNDELLSVFLRQTMSLNLDDVMESFTQTRTRQNPEDSIAGAVEKQAVLDWLEQEEHDKEQALSVAHDENISEWIQLIHKWLKEHQFKAQFSTLVGDLQQVDPHLNRVAVWLGLLLGGFALERAEDKFYSRDYWISGEAVGLEILND